MENGPTTIPLPHVGNQRLRPGFNFHKVKGDQFLIMAAVRQTSAGDTTGGSVGRECPSPSAAPIRLLLQNRTPAVAATQTRIDTAGISRSESAGHDAELADAPTPVNSQTGYSAGVTAVRMGVGGRWTCRPLRGLSLFGFGFYKDCAPDGAGRGRRGRVRTARFQISDFGLQIAGAVRGHGGFAVPNSLAAGLHGVFKQALSAAPEELKPFPKRSPKNLLDCPNAL